MLFGLVNCNTAPDDSDEPFKFLPPAFIQDFADNPAKQEALIDLWTVNLNGFTKQGMLGDAWNASNMNGITNYFNPVKTAPAKAAVADIIWGAWPGRIGFYFDTLSDANQLSISDRGLMADGSQPPDIPADPCDLTNGQKIAYGPYGPRGFQDEYCEWSVQRNESGKITRLDFTCENPEYWNTLWMIDPDKALEVYQKTLDYATITMNDLVLKDVNGNVVVDPSTNRPAYNPLNKFNSGSGGAMHLTSTPNTIQTEIGLATSSTLQRTSGNASEQDLLCCGNFGQAFRNSDPHIGGSVNRVVEAGFQVTLTNPPGLYIQMPNFSQYKTPDGTNAADFWTIVRGTKKLVDQYGDTLPGNYILHAKFEVPSALGYTVGDIKIANAPIQWGGQVARTFNMQIVASALSKSAGKAMDCTGPPTAQTPAPQQLFHNNVFTAMLNTPIQNPVQQPENLLSNSTFIAPKLIPGSTNVPMVLTVDSFNESAGAPGVTFTDPGITATFEKSAKINYTVPGNSYPSSSVAIFINVDVSSNVKPGAYGILVNNANAAPGPAMPSLIHIVQTIK